MNKSAITIDNIIPSQLRIVEYDLARTINSWENKALSLRTTINKTSLRTDIMYVVRDLNQPIDQRIQLITSDLNTAIDRYNNI